ncbi:hypothetical protein V6N12_068621 [Hibiscus sabdariffa]|uniref:Uncharacterized protein n=1 Tax=Hibiscus sabdariffa TaxID=183260 RepID=A0ABR2FR83_9ROSI
MVSVCVSLIFIHCTGVVSNTLFFFSNHSQEVEEQEFLFKIYSP